MASSSFTKGVQPSRDGDQWFSEVLAGGGDLSSNYKTLADMCGLRFQLDYFALLSADMAARPERHVAADVTTADMKREFERLSAADPDFAARAKAATTGGEASGSGPGGLSSLIGVLDQSTDDPRRLAGYACRGIFTWLLSPQNRPSGPFDPVIRTYRNAALADRIIAEPHAQTYVTYGAAHLPGLLEDLRAEDPRWTIVSVKWLRAISQPDDLHGQLASL